MSDDTITIRMRLRDGARFAAQTRLAKKEIKDLGDEAERAGRKGKKAGREMGIMGIALKTIAIAALALAQPIAASSLALVGFTAALAPAVGLLGALPAGIALGGQVFAVLTLSLGGVTKAVGGLNKAMDPKKFAALSPHAQKLALVLDALKPRVKGLRESIQAGLFPGLTAGLIAAAPALNALKGPLGGTGKAIGGFAAHLGQLVGSKGFLSDLTSQARFNNVQITRLGGAGLHLVNIFRNLMVGSRGLVSWLVQLIGKWSAHADALSTTSRASGGMQKAFHTVEVTLSRVGRLFLHLAVALFNIGRVGKTQIGDGILVYLLKSATALERWTRSDEGVNKLNGAFAWAHRELHMIAVAVATIASSAGPGLGTGLRNLSNALTPLLTNTSGPGVLALYVQGLGDLAAAAGFIEHNVPGATTALSALFAVLLLSKLSNVNLLKLAFKALGFALLFVTAPAEAAATAFWALDGALGVLFAPVTLIIAAIAAVAYGFYLAYTKIGWFHRAVDNVVKFVKTHWKQIGKLLLGPLQPVLAVIGLIVKGFGKIKGFLGGVIGKAGKVLSAINPFADGGIVNTPLQLVGEHGPELTALPMGTRVFTAAQTVGMLQRAAPHVQHPRRAPVVAPVHRGRRNGPDDPDSGAQDSMIHLHSTTVLKVDGKVLAKVVSDEVAKAKGR